jgi:hypothetical protein
MSRKFIPEKPPARNTGRKDLFRREWSITKIIIHYGRKADFSAGGGCLLGNLADFKFHILYPSICTDAAMCGLMLLWQLSIGGASLSLI